MSFQSALVHWCRFHAARGQNEWRIHIYCDVLLLKQLLPDVCQAAGDFYFPAKPHVHKSTQLLRHKTRDFTADVWLFNRPKLSPVDHRMWTVIQECIYQEQQRTSNIVDELVIRGYDIGPIIFYNVGYRNTNQERWAILLQFCCKLLQYLCAKELSKYKAV